MALNHHRIRALCALLIVAPGVSCGGDPEQPAADARYTGEGELRSDVLAPADSVAGLWAEVCEDDTVDGAENIAFDGVAHDGPDGPSSRTPRST
ncbi:MAG: hypothetical protein ABIK09_01640 [Pseudomonadota bacterium]